MSYCKYCMAPLKKGEECGCGLNTASYRPAQHHLQPGTVLQERYLVGRVLGEGGFGITYVGRDLKLGLKVAIKEYYPCSCASRTSALSRDVYSSYNARETFEKGKEKFLREARTMGMLDRQPNIVGVKDFFEENNTAYIVMEYIEGTTLKALMAEKGGRIPSEELLPMLRPVFMALENMHKTGLIHRDISPDNLMIENGSLKLLDFGCAKDMEDGTETQTITLKHGYAPLEQYQLKGQGPWTDVYAFAASIYYLLTGSPPPRATDRITDDEIVPPSKCGAKLSSQQEAALMKALAVRHTDRFQSMEEFRQAFYEEVSMPPSKKKMAAIVAAIAALCAVVAVAVGLGLYLNQDRNELTIDNDPPSNDIIVLEYEVVENLIEEAPASRILDNSRIRSNNYYDISEITAIIFLDSTESAPEDAWDFSLELDGSVLAWLDETALYVASDGGVIADENGKELFYRYTSLETIDLSGLDMSGMTTMYAMFLACESLTNINFGDADTSNVTDMTSMFESCASLETVDVSALDTGNVTSMTAMFSRCEALLDLDLSTFDTSNVTMMDSMFYECQALISVNLEGFDTSNVETMCYMFYDCDSLVSIDISGFDTSKVTNMDEMFFTCRSLTSIDLSMLNTSSVTNMGSMFFLCKSLESVNLGSIDTRNVTNISYMFAYCEVLSSIDLSGLDLSNVIKMECICFGCDALEEFIVNDTFGQNATSTNMMFYSAGITEDDITVISD